MEWEVEAHWPVQGGEDAWVASTSGGYWCGFLISQVQPVLSSPQYLKKKPTRCIFLFLKVPHVPLSKYLKKII